MRRLLFYLFIIVPSVAGASEIVAVLDLKFVKETESVAAWMCYGEHEEDCHPWAYFYVFDATVQEVVTGNLTHKKIKVLFGRHALKKGRHKNIVASLSRLPGTSEADYQIVELGSIKKMYCFSDNANKLYNVRLETSKADLKCYEKK